MNNQEYVLKLTANISEFTKNLGIASNQLELTKKQAKQFSQNLSKALNSATPSVQKLGQNMKTLASQYNSQIQNFSKFSTKLAEATSNVTNLTQAHTKQTAQIEVTKHRIDELTKAYESAKATAEALSDGPLKSLTAYNKELAYNSKNIKKTEEALQSYHNELQRIHESTDEALSRARTDDQARITLEVEEKQIASLNNRYADKIQLLDELKTRQEELQQIITATQNAEGLAATIKEENQNLKEQQRELANTDKSLNRWNNIAEQSSEKAHSFAERATNLKEKLLQMSQTAGKLTSIKAVFSGLASVFADFGKKVTSLAGKLAGLTKQGFSKMGNGIKSLFGNFKEHITQSHTLTSAVQKLTSSFGSWENMLIRRFRRQIISSIFNGLKEGIQSVAKESDSFNAALSSMFGSLKTFANALASAFAPLIETVAPIVTSFVNYLTGAVNQVAQLTASLTGKDSFLQAIPVSEDYAASLDETAKNADKAAQATDKQNKSTKNYERTIMSFDQLHTLNKKEKDDGGADDTEKAEKKFNKTKIDTKVSGIANKLLKAFKSGDWKKLGSMMADGVNKAFSWADNLIKWENCGERIKKIITAITKTFNSLVKNIDWKLIGQTIGDGINTIVNSIQLFQRGIDWGQLGSKLGDMVKSMFDTVDWANVGDILVGHLQTILYTVQGFVSTPGLFYSMGQALHDGISGIIDAIDPTAYGDTLAKSINGFFTILEDGFSDFSKFEELGSKVASNINTLFGEFDPQTVASGISNVAISLLTSLVTAIEETDWQQVGTKVAEFVGSIKWSDLSDKLFEGIGAVLGGIGEFLIGLIEPGWDDAVKWWEDNAFEDGEFSMGKLLDGIVNKLLDIGTWIKDHVFTPFADGIAKAFGFDDSGEMFKAGGKILNKMLDGIKGALSDIGNWVEKNIFKPIKGAIKVAFGFVGNAAKGVMDIGSGIIKGIKDGLAGIGTEITNALSAVENALAAPFRAAWNIIEPIINKIKSFDPQAAANSIVQHSDPVSGFIYNLMPAASRNMIDLAKQNNISFATGGFPEDGLFFANHNELVGQFANGKTAVSNNMQIIQGIKQGVKEAMNESLARNNRNQGGGDIVLVVGDEELARAVNRGQAKIDKRYNPSIVFA